MWRGEGRYLGKAINISRQAPRHVGALITQQTRLPLLTEKNWTVKLEGTGWEASKYFEACI